MLRITKIVFLFLLLAVSSSTLLAQAFNQTDSKGRKQGPWRKNFPDGTIRYEGSFKDDNPDGVFRYYTEEGILKMVSFFFDTGKRSRSKGFDAAGKVISLGNYVNQAKDSIWTYYSSDSTVASRESWTSGKCHGPWIIYYPSGQISEEVIWNMDVKQGPWIQYYEDGKQHLKANFVNGQIEGKFSLFYPNGQTKLVGMYKEGAKEGPWYHYESNGNLEKIEKFINGLPENQIEYKEGDLKKLENSFIESFQKKNE